MRKVLFTLLLTSAFLGFSQNTKMFHKARIYYSSQDNLIQLSEAGIAINHGKHKKNIFIESDFSELEIETARNMGYNVDIIINNVGEFYVKQNSNSHQKQKRNINCSNSTGLDYQTPVNYDIKPGSNFGGFYTYSEMLQELDDMAAMYPNLITIRSNIKDPTDTSSPHKHETSEGRYLQWVKISDNPNTDESNEPQILYTGIHHAREPASLQHIIFYMWYLLENYNSSDEIKTIVDNTELFFIPCVNPDGYIYNETNNPNGGGMWRKNRRGGYGVDNNRNYSYITPNGQEVWNTSGTSNNQNGETYAGSEPFSEPENKAVRYFIEKYNFTMALNSHSYGELLLFPYGYAVNKPTQDHSTFQSISGIMVAKNGYDNIISSQLYPAAGDSDDFMYGMLTSESGGVRNKIFAMTPEIGDSFWPASNSIEGICKDMMYHNIIAAKSVHNYANIEDTNDSFINTNTFNAAYTIQRIGILGSGDFTVSINPISSNIISVGNNHTYNGLTIGNTISDNISITLNSNINSGDQITYELVVNNGLFDTKKTVTKTYGALSAIFNDVANNMVNWNGNSWTITNATYVSPSSSITDSHNSNYSNNENSVITLGNSIDLSTAISAQLSFYAKWDIENNYDYAQLEVSTDNGGSWIPQCGKYTNNGTNSQTGAENEPIYDGIQTDWVHETINLSDYLGEDLLIRFKLISDGYLTKDGFYFDDLQVKTLDQNLSTPDIGLSSVAIFPNPTNDRLYIKTDIESYNVKIHSIQGQLIYESRQLSGNNDVNLRSFAKGVYLMTISSEEKQKTFKVLKK